MKRVEARRRAYAIAAAAMRRAMQGDLAWDEDLPDRDLEEIQDACTDLIELFQRRAQPASPAERGDQEPA